MSDESPGIAALLRQLDEQPDEAPEAEAPASEEVTENAVPEGQEETPEPVEPVKEGDDTLEIESLSDLATHLGVDVADLYKVRVPLAGNESATLGEWKDRAQALKRAQALENETRERAQAAMSRLQQSERALTEKIQAIDLILGEQEKALGQVEASTRWDELRQTDPAEYAARRQEQHERRMALEAKKAQAREIVQRWTEERQESAQKEMGAILQREEQSLLDKIPEWRDPEKGREGKARLAQYLKGEHQFSDAEISGITDHRAVLIARKAMLYDEQLKARKTAETKKAVKIGTKTLTPSARETRDDTRARELQEAKSALRKTGDPKAFGRVLRLLG